MPSISSDGKEFYFDDEVQTAIEELAGIEVVFHLTTPDSKGRRVWASVGMPLILGTKNRMNKSAALHELLVYVLRETLPAGRMPSVANRTKRLMSLVPEAKANLAARALGSKT